MRLRDMLRRTLRRFLPLLALLAPAPAAAQGPGGPLWDSYARAVEVLRRGIEAHGGAAAIRALSTASFRWEGEDYAPTQGRVPSAAFDTAGNGRSAVQEVRVDYERGRFRIDREFRFPGGYLNASRVEGEGREQLSYNPYPERGMGGTSYSRDTTGAAARRTLASAGASMPVLLLRSVLGRASTLRWLGETRDGGRVEHAVTHTDAEGGLVTLYFDAATGLLSRREEMGIGTLGDEVDSYHFDDYRTVEGVAVPHRMEVRWNGILTGRHRLARFSRAAGLPDSLLRLPAGYVAAAGAGGPPVAVKVAEGVYYVERIGGGYRMLVVDTDEGVVAVDAPISAAATEAALAVIERTLPGRPIRWLVITHHHNDHIGGVPAFAARGATVLVAPGSEAYVRKLTTVPRTLGQVAGAPARAPEPDVQPLSGRRTIGSGERAVQVLDVGPTSHASSMLAVWLPAQGILFQGDLLRINEQGGPVVSPEATRDLEGIIRRFGLEVRSIGAVHGLNGTLEELRAALRKGETATPR